MIGRCGSDVTVEALVWVVDREDGPLKTAKDR